MINFLITLVGTSAALTGVMLILILLKNIMRKRFTAGCRFIIWLLVILRLCIPLSLFGVPALINLPLLPSLQGGTPIQNDTPPVLQPPIQQEDELNVPPSYEGNDEPYFEQPSGNIGGEEQVTDPHMMPVIQQESGEKLDSETNIEPEGMKYNIPLILLSVWFVVAVLSLLYYLVDYLRYIERVDSEAVYADEELLAVYENLCRKKGIKRPPQLYVSDKVNSPMLMGYFKPMIVLPDLKLSDSAAESVIAHELTHFKRLDLWTKLAGVLARSIHWFNPFVVLGVRMLNEEMELSCDELILREMDEEGRIEYGEVMLGILKHCSGRANPLSTHFNPNKNTVKGRLQNILDSTKKNKGIALIALCLVLCIVAGSVFGCASVAKNADGYGENKTESENETEPEYETDEGSKAPAVIPDESTEEEEVPSVDDDPNGFKTIDYYPIELNSAWDWENKKLYPNISIRLTVPGNWDMMNNFDGFIYSGEGSKEDLVLWPTFYIEEDYKFKDDFIDYGEPIVPLGVFSLDEIVFTPHDLSQYAINKGTTAGGYEYISYESEYYYAYFIRSTANTVFKLNFGTHVDKELVKSIVDGAEFVVVDDEAVAKYCATTMEGIDKLYIDDSVKAAAKAFLNKDVKTLTKMTWNNDGVLDSYKNLELGDFRFWVYNERGHKRVRLTVDIKKADGLDIYTGKQRFDISSGVNGVTIKYLGQGNGNVSSLSKVESAFLLSWLNTMGFGYDIEYASDIKPEKMADYSASVYEFLYGFIKRVYAEDGVCPYTDGEIAEMTKAYAEKLFGLKDHSGYDKVFKTDSNGNIWFAYGRGGALYCIDVYKNSNPMDNTFYVRYYADNGATVKSHYVEYTVIPGETMPESISCNVIEYGEFEPFLKYS